MVLIRTIASSTASPLSHSLLPYIITFSFIIIIITTIILITTIKLLLLLLAIYIYIYLYEYSLLKFDMYKINLKKNEEVLIYIYSFINYALLTERVEKTNSKLLFAEINLLEEIMICISSQFEFYPVNLKKGRNYKCNLQS